MAKSQCHSMKRLRPTSPSPAPPPALENDDLLAEFLLRLPPQPSTLPRAGLACKRWRRVVTDPRFVRRFRALHRRTPPLHGFIRGSGLFYPTQAPPDRLPPSRFWRDRWCGAPDFQYDWGVYCCRHGLVLCGRREESASEFLVVDPVTGHRGRRIGVLQHEGALLMASAVVSAARSGADRSAFLVVALLAHDHLEMTMRVTASVYTSDSGAWDSSGADAAAVFLPSSTPTLQPSSLVGNAIYWSLFDGEIVRFDLGTRRLSTIEERPRPPDVPHPDLQQVRVPWINLEFRSWILPSAAGGDDGRFCVAILCRRSIEFWEREAELGDAAAKWVLCRTVELDKVLPVGLVEEHVQTMWPLRVGFSGFDEENNAFFLWTDDGIFMSHIDSMQFRKVLERQLCRCYLHPYSSL